METSSTYNQARYRLALALLEVEAVLTADSNHPLVVEGKRPKKKRKGKQRRVERGFKLYLHERNPTAPLVPFYFDFRTLDHPTKPGPLTRGIVDLAARCMRGIEFQEGLVCHAMVGVPRTGNPFAQALARLSGVPCIELDKLEKGEKRCIASLKEPVPESVQKVLVVDDLVTGASSTSETVLVLRDAGLEITDVIVLVDRDQGGREKLADLGCELHAIFTAIELFDLYARAGKVRPRIYNRIEHYINLQQI